MTDFILNPLSQEQRIRAQKAAKRAVVADVGKRPERRDFNNSADQKYPAWLTAIILFFCVVMLAAAFLPSAIRLYDIGKNTFQESINDGDSAAVAGICIILMAETGAVLFTMALAVLTPNEKHGRWQFDIRQVFVLSAAVCVAVALAGNYFVAIEPKESVNFFGWLEALAPPILTLTTAYVLKEISLNAISQRHADNVMYRAKLGEWELQTSDPEKHPKYIRFYANELQDALKKANKKLGAFLDEITDEEWREYIRREFTADQWYEQVNAVHKRKPVNTIERSQPVYSEKPVNGNGHHVNGNYERSYNPNGYKKTMNAREVIRDYFINNPDRIDASLNELAEEISAVTGHKIKRGSVHNVRVEFKQ